MYRFCYFTWYKKRKIFLSTKFNTTREPRSRFYDQTTVPLLSMFCDSNYYSSPGSSIGASLTLVTLSIKIQGGRMLLTMFPRATRLNVVLTFTKGEHMRSIRHKFLNQAHVELNLIIVLLEMWNSICFRLNLKVKLLSAPLRENLEFIQCWLNNNCKNEYKMRSVIKENVMRKPKINFL